MNAYVRRVRRVIGPWRVNKEAPSKLDQVCRAKCQVSRNMDIGSRRNPNNASFNESPNRISVSEDDLLSFFAVRI